MSTTIDRSNKSLFGENSPNISTSIQSGLAIAANGQTVDLLKIQAVCNRAFQQLGSQEFADAANELSKLTGMHQGANEQWIANGDVLGGSPVYKVGNYEIKAAVDADGHLTMSVNSTDGSPVHDVGEDVVYSDNEFAVRLTTSEIERQYQSQN